MEPAPQMSLRPWFSPRIRSMPVRVSCARLIVLSVLLSLLAGCQFLPQRQSIPEPEPEPEAGPPPSTPAPAPPASAEQMLSEAIDLMNQGLGQQALNRLREIQQRGAGSAMVTGLVRQITEPPEALLPGPYRRVTVAPGESLALIAGRELGDSLQFYALARLNGIEVPRQLPVGVELRVPSEPLRPRPAEAQIAQPGAGGEPPAEPEPSDESDIEMVARYLEASDQREQARRMLIDALAGPDRSRDWLGLLESMTARHAMSAAADGRREAALVIIDQTLQAVPAARRADMAELVPLRSRLEAELLIERSRTALSEKRLADAVRLAGQARRLQPESESIGAASSRIRQEFVETLHNRALTAWRDRNIDLAIRTWQALLAEVPDFEPASVYLERALELRQRLGALPD